MRALGAERVLNSAKKAHGSWPARKGCLQEGGSGPGAQEEPGGVARGPPTLRLEESVCNKGLGDRGLGLSAEGRRKETGSAHPGGRPTWVPNWSLCHLCDLSKLFQPMGLGFLLVTWWRPYHLTGYPHGSWEALGTASVWSRVSLDLRSAALPEPESPTCSLCALNINLQTHIRDATLAIYTPHPGFGEKGNYGAKMHVNETLGSIPHGPGVSAKRCAGAAALDWDEMMHNWYSHQRKCQSNLIQEHILKIIN